MLEKNFSIIDYLVFGVFLSFSTLIGIYFAIKNRKNPSKDEFLTGGKNLDVFPVCMSLIASFLSSNTILGVPAEIYLYGTQFSVHLITFTIAVLLAANVFMPVYYKLNLTSVHKYLLRRFGMNAVRLSGSIGFILCTLPYLGVVLYGPSLALASVTPLSMTTSILVVGVICTFYTSIGGIKAVIWTDVMQTILMFSGLLMVAIVGSIESGFIESWKIAYNNNRLNIFNPTFSLYRGDIFWSVFFGTLTGWTGTYCVKQTQVQRYCCLGSPAKAKKALYWNIPGVLIISFIAIWCGIVIFAKYNGCDPIALGFIDKHDQLMPYFVMDTLSNYPGLPGLFVCCVFSGSLSTLSSGFNALATVTWDDFIKRYFRDIKEKKQLMITKIIAMSYGILAIAIAFFIGRLGTVLQASHALTGSITGPLLALFCLGIFFPCVNAIGAITGLISGVGMCLFITIGTLVYPRPKGFQLPVSVNSCPAEIIEHISYDTFISATQRHYSVDYHPK
ncbi:sodium-coupled monocarboxylate transporter 2-like [Oppia nitens]|uniref:sodium-coupled monocarboxylate transporter 2-like n=1 Tax=Oppia nitens TaxID=1686743 RepID=UPI0023D9EDA8|nr:sodium-coupled monocarboxylate transporter 2-like [Oppia nitens]